jgi:hypothetical protein
VTRGVDYNATLKKTDPRYDNDTVLGFLLLGENTRYSEVLHARKRLVVRPPRFEGNDGKMTSCCVLMWPCFGS